MIARREHTTPRRPAHLHRHPRAPLPSVRHRPGRHRHRLPRSALPRTRPLRTTDLRHQSHRPHQPAITLVRHQPRLAPPRARAHDLLAWTKLLALHGNRAWPMPNRNGFATAYSTPPPESVAPADKPPADSPSTGPGPPTSSPCFHRLPPSPTPLLNNTRAAHRRPQHRPPAG